MSSIWQRLSGINYIVPLYHAVTDEPPIYIQSLYPIKSSKDFEADLEYMLKHFDAVDIFEFKNRLTKKKAKPFMHLTFDDGLRSCSELIAPMLLKKGIPASFFINPNFIDNENFLDRFLLNSSIETLMKDQPYMTKAQLVQLKKEGFSIGGHSMSHPRFKEIDLDMQKEETVACFEWLKKELDVDQKYFAFPFTDDGVHAEFFNWMYQDCGADLSFGTAGIKRDMYQQNIQRLPMETGRSAKIEIDKNFRSSALKRAVGFQKVLH